MGLQKWILGLGVIGAASEYGITRHFLNKTVLRNNAKQERTTRMAGTNQDDYIPNIRAYREWLETRECEDVSMVSGGGLKPAGSYYPAAGARRAVLCFRSYTSEGWNNFPCIAKFYLEQGYSVLLVGERAHNRNEGIYIGLGCLDQYDVLTWLDYLLARFGTEWGFILHGMSMDEATVLTNSGLSPPPQVKGVAPDCGFTSAWDVFTSVPHNMHYMSISLIMQISDRVAREKAGYGPAECNAVEKVRRAEILILFTHGDADAFVLGRMCHELYNACASGKGVLVIEEVVHTEAYRKDTGAYEGTLKKLPNELEKEKDRHYEEDEKRLPGIFLDGGAEAALLSSEISLQEAGAEHWKQPDHRTGFELGPAEGGHLPGV